MLRASLDGTGPIHRKIPPGRVWVRPRGKSHPKMAHSTWKNKQSPLRSGRFPPHDGTTTSLLPSRLTSIQLLPISIFCPDAVHVKLGERRIRLWEWLAMLPTIRMEKAACPMDRLRKTTRLCPWDSKADSCGGRSSSDGSGWLMLVRCLPELRETTTLISVRCLHLDCSLLRPQPLPTT